MFGLLGHSDSGTASRHTSHSSVGRAVTGCRVGALEGLLVGLIVGSAVGVLLGEDDGK